MLSLSRRSKTGLAKVNRLIWGCTIVSEHAFIPGELDVLLDEGPGDVAAVGDDADEGVGGELVDEAREVSVAHLHELGKKSLGNDSRNNKYITMH